jgi:A/G-specific adenine glycosylase
MGLLWEHADEIRHSLLAWFDASKRDLPWRTSRSVYATLVSEVMLQQTQVATVLPYFERWMQCFPDFGALARAPEAEVLRLWEGLGYYSRVKNLQAAARLIVEQGIPHDGEWRRLPGIGPYTAAAVASMAQGCPVAAVDGNVVRVLARLRADASVWSSSSKALKHYTPLAQALLSHQRPGDFNEALMELGATVCRPKGPLCLLCPLKPFCLAALTQCAHQCPAIQRRATVALHVQRAYITSPDQGLLLYRHPVQARRLAGLYELPDWTVLPFDRPLNSKLLLRAKRGISNQSICEEVWSMGGQLDPVWMQGIGQVAGLHWVQTDCLETIALSGPHRQWLRQLMA